MMDEREELERTHRLEVKSAFSNYASDMRQEHGYLFTQVTSNEFYKRNQERKAIMMDHALKQNQLFLDAVIRYINEAEDDDPDYLPLDTTTSNNRSKIKTTLKQFYREWCGDSAEKADYAAIAETCRKYLKQGDVVLVPGCGLGRLVFDLVAAGFGA
jgi:carnosine N-methyltransferase